MRMLAKKKKQQQFKDRIYFYIKIYTCGNNWNGATLSNNKTKLTM